MENDNFFRILQESRDLILLTEIIGWLHDIDKLDERFFCLYKNSDKWPDGKKITFGENGHIIRAMIELDLPLNLNESSPEHGKHGIDDKYEYFGSIKGLPHDLINFFKSDPPFTQMTQKIVDTSKNGSPILRHQIKPYRPTTVWEQLICGSDSKDSKEDRGQVSGSQSKLMCSPFGDSSNIDTMYLRKERNRIYRQICLLLEENKSTKEFRKEGLKIVSDSFKRTVADTRYPVNDISLLDHNYMTGVIAKSVLLTCLLNEEMRSRNQNFQDIDKQIRNKLTFQALSITFDPYSYISNSIKLADLIGRTRLYQKIRESIKELLEVEIPIGSSIYEDLTNIIFLTPELEPQMWKTVEKTLTERVEHRIFKILENELNEDLSENELSSIAFSLNPRVEILSPEREIATLVKNGIENSKNYLRSKELSNLSVNAISKISEMWKNAYKEKCHICGLLPKELDMENEKLCRTCFALRYKGRHEVREENIKMQNTEEIPESIWLDEIKDENNTIALIVGRVTPLERWLKKDGYVEMSTFVDHNKRKPKNLSASRARAIWRTINEFAEESSEIIKTEAYGCIWRIEKVPKELERKLDENPNVSILFEEETIEGYFYTHESELETLNALDEELACNLLEERTIKISHEKDIFELRAERRDLKHFYTSRVIYSHAGEFISIIPGKEAIDGILQIKDRFSKSFNKVFGMLSMNLGLIYFKHKTPLYIAFDSAKRMINNFNELSTKKIDAKINYKDTHGEHAELILDIKEKKIRWLISTQFPDGQADHYYPYFFVGNDDVKHVCEINQNDVISIHPSYFDFEFLDTSTRRFDMILEDEKRPHRIFNTGSRPYFLEEIDNFKNLWNILCGGNGRGKKMTASQLQNFHALLVSKIEEWNLRSLSEIRGDIFKKLVEDSIINILDIQREIKKDDKLTDFEFIRESVLSGLFFDVFELYVTIMKQELEGDENEH